MSGRPLMLGGEVDNRDEVIHQLRHAVQDLQRELREVRADAAAQRQLNRDAERAVGELRRQLTPLYQALQAVFGEMDSVAPGEDAGPQVDGKKRGVWESWISKLGGKPADCIRSLLDHGEMNAVQLRVAMKCHINSVYEATAKLQKLGLVNKSGGRYSLKEL